MASLRFLIFLTVATVFVSLIEAQPILIEPGSLLVNPNDSPVFFLREKRSPVGHYPHRTMMFTGYYKPVRRSNNGDHQATGIFAQGNAVSGKAYLGDLRPDYLRPTMEQNEEEPAVSSAEAAAAPNFEESLEEEQEEEERRKEERVQYHDSHHDQHHHDTHHNEDDSPYHQAHTEKVPILNTTEVVVTEESINHTEKTVTPTRKKTIPKKNKKIPIPVEHEDEEELDEEYDDEPVLPFVLFRGQSRRRNGYPNLNNFFPMIFTFPGVSARSDSAGSPPGAITAIANSYSTAKGGVASSVATAYGGSPNGKKQRHVPSSEQ